MRDTREKLLNTATKMFANMGYDAVSTRDLVYKSGVNLCTINYYFGSKQKLYDAVIDRVIESVKTSLLDKMGNYIAEHKMTPEQVAVYVVGEFFDFIFSRQVSDSVVLMTVREFLLPNDKRRKIDKLLMRQLVKYMENAVKSGGEYQDADAGVVAQCILNQALGFKFRQNSNKYTGKQLSDIRARLLENTKILLRGRKCLKD